MKTIKLFATLLIVFILLFIFVDFMSFAYIGATYQDITCKDQVEGMNVQIQEAKATYVNGYVKGKVTNSSNATITNQYLAIDCYSKQHNNLETSYTSITELAPGQTKDFEIKFKCEQAHYLNLYASDDKPEGYHVERSDDADFNFALLISGLILLYYFG